MVGLALVSATLVRAAPSTRPAVLDAATLEAEVQAVAANCVANTVGLVHQTGDGKVTGVASGSGVLVSADGLILTAGHVIEKPGTVLTVRFADGRVFHGKAVGLDHLTDTGIARITDPAPAGGWPFAPMAPANSFRPGDWVLATGNAGSIVVGRNPPLRVGRITTSEPTVFRTNCALEPGDSGGPVFDLSGRVIGINSRIAAAGPTVALKEYISLHTPVGAFDTEWSSLLGGMNGHPNVNLDTAGRRRRPLAGQVTRFRGALGRLVAAKDPEVMKLLADAKANNDGRLALSPDKMDELIRRADALPATTQPSTRPTALARATTGPTTAPVTAVASATPPPARPTTAPSATAPPQRGVPLAMRPRYREQLRASILREFPSAKVTDDLLNHMLDRASIDPDTHLLRLKPEVDDLKAMGLSDQAIMAMASGNSTPAGRAAMAWGKTSLQTLALFAPALAETGDCVVEVRAGNGSTVLMGTIVDPDGWVITKASDLPDLPVVVLPNGKSLVAHVAGKDRATDLALLKVAATGLTAARFAEPGAIGELVFCPTVDPNQPAVGCVSVAARPVATNVPAFAGEHRIVLGVQFKGDNGIVNVVTPDMPAAIAGVLPGDQIVSMNGKPVSSSTELTTRLKDVHTGDAVTLGLRRGGKTLDVKPVIGVARATTQTIESLGQTDQYAGGKLSKRRTDFPEVIETDAAIWADQCGGPLVNLRGEAIGVAIARYDRVCTFVLPADLVQRTVEHLRAAPVR